MKLVRCSSAFVMSSLAVSMMFALGACTDSSSGTVSEGLTDSSEGPVDERFAELNARDAAYCNAQHPDGPPYECDESLEMDGAFYIDSDYKADVEGDCIYKCKHNKWSVVSAKDIPANAKAIFDYEDPYIDETLILQLKKCNSEHEGLVDSVCTFETKGRCAEYSRYKCEQGTWNYMDLNYCNIINPKDGDECCIATDSMGVKKSFLSVFTTSYGWVRKASYSDSECKDVVREYDVCSEPKEACTQCDAGKIDSMTSINSSNTCYAMCTAGSWVMLSETAEQIAVREYCGPASDGGYLCCYPESPESDDGIFYQSAAKSIFKRDYYTYRYGSYFEVGEWRKTGESCKVSELPRPEWEILFPVEYNCADKAE
ncbi:MAG: hypothetical protein IK012_04885 [Fibrobacter sp.]|uniref:hypothetical protein n=1 Tax=Fibrobacter sp. TaxID=35828 RepID=UPI0025C5ABC1|nr:hypothetical protein [Fibrobacter sp.]MBR4784574.1 hypothetical protein [Fibrobacter sp.]